MFFTYKYSHSGLLFQCPPQTFNPHIHRHSQEQHHLSQLFKDNLSFFFKLFHSTHCDTSHTKPRFLLRLVCNTSFNSSLHFSPSEILLTSLCAVISLSILFVIAGLYPFWFLYYLRDKCVLLIYYVYTNFRENILLHNILYCLKYTLTCILFIELQK